MAITCAASRRRCPSPSTRSRARFGFRSPTSRPRPRRRSRSCPSAGRDAFMSFRSSATEQELVIATADPLDVDCERTLGFATGRTCGSRSPTPTRSRGASRRCIAATRRAREREALLEVQHLDNAEEGAPPTPATRRRLVRHPARRRAARRRHRRAGERHSHRAGGAGHRRPAPRRRRARARAHAAARRRPGARVAHQDPLRSRHRRPAAAAGRPRSRRDQRRRGRPSRLHAAGVARRESRRSRARRPRRRCTRSKPWAFTTTSSSDSAGCCSRAKG